MSVTRPPKRQHEVKLRFDDEEMIDLMRVAASQQRCVADSCRVSVLNAMYGILGRAERRSQRNRGDSAPLIVPTLEQADFEESGFGDAGLLG